MDTGLEPTAKRRKLSDIPPAALSATSAPCSSSPTLLTDLPEPFQSQYIVLARAECPILVGFDAFESSYDYPAKAVLDLAIEDLDLASPYRVTVKKSPRAKRSHLLEIAAPSAKDLQVLEDSKHLSSVARHNGGTSLPLACFAASVCSRDNQHFLQILILWQNTAQLRDKIDSELFDVMDHYFPGSSGRSLQPEPWDPRQFYDNVHVPDKSEAASAQMNVPFLVSDLYPFQRRAVRWLLQREGVELLPNGNLSLIPNSEDSLPTGFESRKLDGGGDCVVNKAVGMISTEFEVVRNFYRSVRGGILAEEMGLGKTLEIISLTCLHRRRDDVATPRGLKSSRSTLIITPVTILEQWKQEISKHAPGLRVYHYRGVSSFKKSPEQVMTQLLEADVVVTTYNVVAREIHYVQAKPDRQLRGAQRPEPPKSPLTQIFWWRVCLDEAQMVESGVSSAAQVAMRIPRHNAWAVTGTPLRKSHKDLFGLFLFLRFEPWSQSATLWQYLVDHHRPMLRDALKQISLRHTKDFVREDLRLPPQSRHIITIPFTPIEDQHYTELFREFCEDCGLDSTGAPLTNDWDPDSPKVIEKLRSWLSRLRQTCLHPEIGHQGWKALRRPGGVLRTVEEVLDVMIDQVEGQVRTTQRAWLIAAIRRGQMKENAKETQQALQIWQSSYNESCIIVDECRRELEREARSGKEAVQDEEKDGQEEDDDENKHLTTLKLRLRAALEIKHVCTFFIANAFFQLKSLQTPDTKEYFEFERQETQTYEEAKSIRGELLAEVLKSANKLITAVTTRAAEDRTQIPELLPVKELRGIESRRIVDRIHAFAEEMNKQAAHFRDVQKVMMKFLGQALLDQDEGIELQGDEYETSTRQQDEMYAYMEALRALLADRNEAITGQENYLIRQEMKQFVRLAKEGGGPAPALMIKLLAEREVNRVDWKKLGSMRGLIGEIRSLVTSLEWQAGLGDSRADHELSVINPILVTVSEQTNVQARSLSNLEQLVNQIRDAMNGRLEFYRALQKISDTVAPFEEDNVGKPLNEIRYQEFIRDETVSKDKVDTLTTRLRYLMHLKTESQSATPRICTICQCDFEVGTLTVCGHQFCKDCILMWWGQHHNCPVCKRTLSLKNFYDITYKPAEVAVQAETSLQKSSLTGVPSERSLNQTIYSDVSVSMMNQIKVIDLPGVSYGSKVDFLCRHLIWLRQNDPGSKSVIFSQYREFLGVLVRAFTACGIQFGRIDDKDGVERFKAQPTVECFLLHAKAHSAGLNLVVANHVFLCEPLINTAIELQAIARVHRIGQQRATTVWMYLIADTVEESIYKISVSRRLSHLTSRPRRIELNGQEEESVQETALDMANSIELQEADLSRLFEKHGKVGGEMVEASDLWPCLFSRVKKTETVMAGVAGEEAGTEVGRFLRGEAAMNRRQ
ncbi:hypothetical protein B0A52_04469 [Exophiala mesophila]|uniref:RING-type domain-containing protein n=1 Tax=Exophiala mesophila TaxID=212818 RepID=A0A438N937_EXOME|nr:hypothetical protein B0A52_04469 [Exophiala mesophila]